MIVPMKRLTLMALKRDEADIMGRLQDAEVVQVVSSESASAPNSELESVNRDVSTLAEALQAVKSFGPKTNMLTPKRRVHPEKIGDGDALAHKACGEIEALVRERARLAGEQEKLHSTEQLLLPWVELPYEMRSVTSTRLVHCFVGLVAKRDLAKLLDQDVLCTELFGDDALVPALVCCHESCAKDASAFIKTLDWTDVTFPDMDGKPVDAIRQLGKRQIETERELMKLAEKLETYGSSVEALQDAVDAAMIRRDRLEAMGELGNTDSVFVLDGWVRSDEVDKAKSAVESVTDSFYFDVRDPKPDEQPPVVLLNKKGQRPFEAVNNLYALPDYRGIDAVPMMAPWYVLLFGMMLSDFGYGLLLLIGSLVFLKLKKPTGMMKGITQVLVWGGASTMLWSVLIGTCFGLEFNDILGTTCFPLIMSPLDNPLAMLGICFGLGIIHMLYGVCIKIKMCLDLGDWRTAVYDNLSWIFIIIGLLVYASPMLITALPSWVSKVGIGMALLGALLIVVFKGRDKKNILSRGVSGLAGLYNITSWLSDVLSYARLFALGVATGIIAQVFNQICSMLMGGSGVGGVIGFILGCVLLVFLHIFNLGINALGSFVHCARLQYVEFYGKFYEAGGKEFRPLGYNPKYTVITKQTDN